MSAKILIVEDEADLVGVLQYNLKREGYAVRTAGTGAEGLRLGAEDPPPDVIILDLMLPDISGIDVCRQLKADARTRGVPVLMLTARGEENDRVRGFEVGADAGVLVALSFVVSYVTGLVVGVTPAGLGIREGLLVAGLSGVYPAPTALAFGIASRVLMTIIEVALVGLAALVRPPVAPEVP